ncbi:MAG: hypothetical protein K2X01_11595 [Cyanobacteria bacterium]|nr:hypothetical protein [Cyanobacteriota bacterium]
MLSSELKNRLWVSTIVLLLSLLSVEVAARIIVSWAVPEQSASRGFDHKYYLARAPFERDRRTVLILGDSLANMGIYSQLLRTRLSQAGIPVSVRNLASSRNTPDMNIALLQSALKAGNHPALVIVNINMAVFNGYYIHHREQTPEPALAASYLGRCELAEPTDFAEKTRCFFEKHLYFIRFRGFFKGQFRTLDRTLFGVEKRLSKNPKDFVQDEAFQEGWSPSFGMKTEEEFLAKNQFNTDNLAAFRKTQGPKFTWEPRPFLKFYTFCRKHHIPLVMVLLPVHPISEQYFVKAGLVSPEANYAREFKRWADNTNSWYLDYYQLDSDSTHFYNTSHLNVLGAVSVTEHLAKDIVPILKKVESKP